MPDPGTSTDLPPTVFVLYGATGDLARVQRQRQLLGAIVERAASPAVLLDPRRSFPAAEACSACT